MNERPVQPPSGYSSWLVYALRHFDASAAASHWMFEDDVVVTSDDVRAALWNEFNALRLRAGLAPCSQDGPDADAALSPTRGQGGPDEFESVWHAIEASPADAEDMRLRSARMRELQALLHSAALTGHQTARMLNVTPRQVADLMHGKINRFSSDELADMHAVVSRHLSGRG